MSVCETSRYGSWQVKLSSTSWDRLAWSVCEYTVHASRSTTASCAQLVQHDGISICIGTDRPTDGRTDRRIGLEFGVELVSGHRCIGEDVDVISAASQR